MEQDKENYYKKKIKSLENKLKKKKKDNFVEKNLSLFKVLLDKEGEFLGHPDLARRYFYMHKRGGKEIPAIKLNVFVQDILMAKVMLNQSLDQKDYAVRYSMAADSLIRHLQKDRIKRPRPTRPDHLDKLIALKEAELAIRAREAKALSKNNDLKIIVKPNKGRPRGRPVNPDRSTRYPPSEND